MSHMLQFINSARFMTSSLSNFFNNLSEGIYRIKCEYGQKDKKCDTCRIKYKHCDYFVKYSNFKYDLIEQKCLCFKKKLSR